jgi:hypothetical protein
MIVTWIFLNAYGHDVAIIIVSRRQKGEQVRNCLLLLNWQLSPAFLVITYNIFPWRLDDLIQGPEQCDILHQPAARHIPPVTGHTYPCSKITLAYRSDVGGTLSKALFLCQKGWINKDNVVNPRRKGKEEFCNASLAASSSYPS